MNAKLKKALQYTATSIVIIFWLPLIAVVLTWGYIGIGIKKTGAFMEQTAHTVLDFAKGINFFIRDIIWRQ